MEDDQTNVNKELDRRELTQTEQGLIDAMGNFYERVVKGMISDNPNMSDAFSKLDIPGVSKVFTESLIRSGKIKVDDNPETIEKPK